LTIYDGVLRPGGHLSLFTYLGTRWFSPLLGRRTLVRQRAVRQQIAQFTAQYAQESRSIWLNLPPAKVQHLGRWPLLHALK
jgi:hypothetical protein